MNFSKKITVHSLQCLLLLTMCFPALADSPRPWNKTSNDVPGANTQIRFADGALYHYGDSLLQSFDFGTTWTPVAEIKGHIVGVAPYVGDGAIVVTQAASGAPVIGYYSLTGTNWEKFDSIPTSSKAVAIFTQGINAYTAMENGKVYVRNTSLDSFTITGQTIRDIVVTPTIIIVATQNSTMYSVNNGAEFSALTYSVNGTELPVFPITVLENKVYGCTSKGAVVLNEDTKTWEPLGLWKQEPLAVHDIDVAAGNFYVLSTLTTPTTKPTRRQLYRFGSTDTTWTAIGDTLPGPTYLTSASPMAFDATRAVLSHIVTDSVQRTGVYVYDVNDFTSVEELIINSSQMPDWKGLVHVNVYDMMGRVLYTTSIVDIRTPLSLPQFNVGIVAISYTNSFGEIWCTTKVQ